MKVKTAAWVGLVEPMECSTLSEAYWGSDETVAALSKQFSIPANQIGRKAGPASIKGLRCTRCDECITITNRTDAITRLTALASTYGWGAAKQKAHVCDSCEKKIRDEKRIADMRKWHTAATRTKADIEAEAARRAELATMPYAEYLKTDEWQERRTKALRRAGFSCQVCYSNERLHVHHRTYSNRGREQETDLTVLCAECHQLFHERMQLAEKRARAAA